MPSSSNDKPKAKRSWHDDPKRHEAWLKALKKAHNKKSTREKHRKVACQNPYFTGEKHKLIYAARTEAGKRNQAIAVAKSNRERSYAGYGDKIRKTLDERPELRQERAMHMSEYWERVKNDEELFKKAQETAKSRMQGYNEIRKKNAKRRRMDLGGVIKPLPNQPDEYYKDLEEFFCEII